MIGAAGSLYLSGQGGVEIRVWATLTGFLSLPLFHPKLQAPCVGRGARGESLG